MASNALGSKEVHKERDVVYYYAADAPPSEGLAVARQEAMIWYRSHEAYDAKFGRRPQPAELERTKSSGSEGEEGNGAQRPLIGFNCVAWL